MLTSGIHAAGEPRKHRKTFTGCWTCRSRKVKCDEARPTCIQCSSKSFECQGYGVRLRWMPPERAFGALSVDSNSPLPNSSKAQRSHIAIDPKRRILQGMEIDNILHSIDTFEICHSHRTGDTSLVIHNFGVFDSLAAGSEATPCVTEQPANSPHSPPCYVTDILPSVVLSTCYEGELSFTGVSSCDTNSEPSKITEPSIFVYDGTCNQHYPQLSVSSHSSPTENPELWQTPKTMTVELSSDEYSFQDEKRLNALPKRYQWQGANGAIIRNPSPNYLPRLEQFLMYHYVHRVVHLFCVIDNDRSPWKTIHLPRALQSVGQLNVEGSSTRIRDALRNALLSVSAFYMANDSRSRMCLDEGARWTSEATLFRGKSIKLLKDAVNNDFQRSPPKYKEFLATMLSMISINVMSGDTSTCEMHLDGAFRLMSQARTRKTKYSAKARSLHRIYFYLRAIYQSTAVMSSSGDPLALQASDIDVPELTRWPQSEMMLISSEICSVPPTRSSESSTQMTTYECIYGVPQSLLILLWESTKLIYELTAVREETRSPIIPDDLVDRCDDLEKCIMDWSIGVELERCRNEQSRARSEIIHQTTLAFHNALIIYFAQNIRCLGHHYLQSYVQVVLDSIEAIERIKAEVHILAAPLYWPAFIAASEAFHEHQQKRFRSWYEHVEMYGIAAVRTGIAVLTEVWKDGPTRRNPLTSHWRSVVKRTNANLMLS